MGEAQEAIERLLERPGYAFTDQQVLGTLRGLHALAATVEAARLQFIAELDTRPHAIPTTRPSRIATTFLCEGLHLSAPAAARDLAAARAIASARPDLPRMGRALARGQISRDHLDVAVSTLRRVPAHLKTRLVPPDLPPTTTGTPATGTPATGTPATAGSGPSTEQCPADGEGPADGGGSADGGAWRTGADVIDEVLADQARRLAPTTVHQLGRQIVHLLDPDHADRFNPDSVLRRSCTVTTDYTGMGLYRLAVDPATHLQLQAVLSRWSVPHPTGTARTSDGATVTLPDLRTPAQRRADAMVACIINGDTTAPANSTRDASHPENPAEEDRTHQDRNIGSPPDDDASTIPHPRGEPDLGTAPSAPGFSTETSGTSLAIRRSTSRETLRETTQETQRAATRETAQGAFREIGGDAAQEIQEGQQWWTARPCRSIQISVLATLDQLAAAYGATDPAARGAGLAQLCLPTTSHATLTPAVLARLACDSPLHRLLTDPAGAVLHHGRTRRLATPAQKRALAARDQGCIIPGCAAPPQHTEAHHLTPWADGGTTDLDSMALLCRRHHTDHHAGLYPIRFRHGVPWVRLPSWQDPSRPWLRNTTTAHHRLAATTATALSSTTAVHRPPDPP